MIVNKSLNQDHRNAARQRPCKKRPFGGTTFAMTASLAFSSVMTAYYSAIANITGIDPRSYFLLKLYAAAIVTIFLVLCGAIWIYKSYRQNQLLATQSQSHQELKDINKKLTIEVIERKKAEEQAKLMSEKAESANKAKSEFLANMSHEIRTPMNAIIGFSEVLKDEDLDDKQNEYLDIIRVSAGNLLNLINDILDFSKIESGKLDTEIIDCSLLQLLAEIESVMHPMAAEKHLEFRVLQCGSLPTMIGTDPFRTRQCLINLINNALKFTSEGHVYLNVSATTIDSKPIIEFAIEDTGIGIEPEKQKEVFNSFTQASKSTSRNFGGTGLGLTITKQLANLLGGDLTVKSKPGTGSTFTFTIPANVDIENQKQFDKYQVACKINRSNIETTESQIFSGNVLVAEDCKTNRDLVKVILEKLGLNVNIAENGKIAVQMAGSHDYDLILMDMQMPEMNGYEATKILKNKGNTTPIIALTANALKGDAEKCTQAGCDDYVAKPYDRNKLIEIIKKYMAAANEIDADEIMKLKSQVDELSGLCNENTTKKQEN